MKSLLLFSFITISVFSTVSAADPHNHENIPAPKGGKLLESEPLHSEFFVQADRKVSITFYDNAMKAVAPAAQEVKVIAEAKSGKAVLEFEKSGNAFVSKTVLPEDDGYRIVVQIKQDAASKPQNFRIDYNSSLCGKCQRAEYACLCAH